MTFAAELQAIGVPAPPELAQLGDARRVTEWARRCHCSRSLLRRRLVEAGYLPPIRYIALRGLVTGLRAMDEGKPASVAAQAAGYPDPFTFSNQCRRVLGRRPSQLRGGDWRRVVRQVVCGR